MPALSRLWASDDNRNLRNLDSVVRLAMLIVASQRHSAWLLRRAAGDNAVFWRQFRRELGNHLSLQAYAIGLVGFSFVKILAPAFFAREDTRTPVRVVSSRSA